MARFVANKEGMNWVLKHPNGPVGRHLLTLGREIHMLARIQVGKKSFALMRSLNYSIANKGGGLVVTVGSANSIALMHHEGTRPHIIMPKRASTLRFYSRGRIVYAKVVRHPGTKPNKYLTDNLRKVV